MIAAVQRAGAAVVRFGAGFRTLIGAAVIGLVGMADIAGQLDLTPLVGYFVGDTKAVGAVMVALSLFFAFMRSITKSPMFEHHDDDHKGVDEGH